VWHSNSEHRDYACATGSWVVFADWKRWGYALEDGLGKMAGERPPQLKSEKCARQVLFGGFDYDFADTDPVMSGLGGEHTDSNHRLMYT
jgi:hypothetical protein